MLRLVTIALILRVMNDFCKETRDTSMEPPKRFHNHEPL